MANVDDLLYAPIRKETPDEFADILDDVAQQQNALNHQLNQQMNQILQGQAAQAQNNPFTGPYNQQHYQNISNQGGLSNQQHGGLSNSPYQQGGLGSTGPLGGSNGGGWPLPTSSSNTLAEQAADAAGYSLAKLWAALPPTVKQARFLEIAKSEYERLPRCLRPGIPHAEALRKIEAMLTGPHNTIE